MKSRNSARSAANSPIKNSAEIKDYVLGKDYDLSLVFCDNRLSRRLNRTYRGKDKPTNVLAFPISESSGEIFINLKKLDGFSPLFLFIHALLHLKGLEHSAKMESEEQKLFQLFNGATSRSRDRYRNSQRKGSNSRRG